MALDYRTLNFTKSLYLRNIMEGYLQKTYTTDFNNNLILISKNCYDYKIFLESNEILVQKVENNLIYKTVFC